MFSAVLRQFGTYFDLISDRIRKNMPARFLPVFGRSPDPGLAGDSKPGGGGGCVSVKAGSGK